MIQKNGDSRVWGLDCYILLKPSWNVWFDTGGDLTDIATGLISIARVSEQYYLKEI